MIDETSDAGKARRDLKLFHVDGAVDDMRATAERLELEWLRLSGSAKDKRRPLAHLALQLVNECLQRRIDAPIEVLATLSTMLGLEGFRPKGALGAGKRIPDVYIRAFSALAQIPHNQPVPTPTELCQLAGLDKRYVESIGNWIDTDLDFQMIAANLLERQPAEK